MRLRDAYKDRCAYCGKDPGMLVREHMMPRSRHGGDEIENMIPACQSCNIKKRNRTPLEWFLCETGEWFYDEDYGLQLTPPQPEPPVKPVIDHTQRPHRAAYLTDTKCWHCGSPWRRPMIDMLQKGIPVITVCAGCKAEVA